MKLINFSKFILTSLIVVNVSSTLASGVKTIPTSNVIPANTLIYEKPEYLDYAGTSAYKCNSKNGIYYRYKDWNVISVCFFPSTTVRVLPDGSTELIETSDYCFKENGIPYCSCIYKESVHDDFSVYDYDEFKKHPYQHLGNQKYIYNKYIKDRKTSLLERYNDYYVKEEDREPVTTTTAARPTPTKIRQGKPTLSASKLDIPVKLSTRLGNVTFNYSENTSIYASFSSNITQNQVNSKYLIEMFSNYIVAYKIKDNSVGLIAKEVDVGSCGYNPDRIQIKNICKGTLLCEELDDCGRPTGCTCLHEYNPYNNDTYLINNDIYCDRVHNKNLIGFANNCSKMDGTLYYNLSDSCAIDYVCLTFTSGGDEISLDRGDMKVLKSNVYVCNPNVTNYFDEKACLYAVYTYFYKYDPDSLEINHITAFTTTTTISRSTKTVPTIKITVTSTNPIITTSTFTTGTLSTKIVPSSLSSTATTTTSTVQTTTTTTKIIPTSSVQTTTSTTKIIPTSTVQTTTTTTSTKTISVSCIPVTITVTEKERATVTEKETVTVTVTSTDPVSDDSKCASKWAQCGGIDYNGPTCCKSGFTCNKVNEHYSQCI